MTEKYITYKYNGDKYDIPESKSAEMEKNYPSATIEMHMDGEIYDIPVSRKQDAIHQYGTRLTYAFEKGSNNSENVETKPEQTQEVKRANNFILPENPTFIGGKMPAPNDEEDEGPSFMESVAKATGSAAIRTGKRGLNLLQVLSSGYLYNDPETGAAKRTPDIDTQLKDKNDTFTAASILARETADKLSREADPTGGEKGFWDLLADGEYGKALQKGIVTTIESAPNTLAAKNWLTMGLNAAGMAAENYVESTLENPEVDQWKRATMAIGSAAIEQAVEKLADPVFKYVGGKKAAKKLTNKAAKEFTDEAVKEAKRTIAQRIVSVLENTAKDSLGEGAEEIITSFGNDALGEALDAIDGNKDFGVRAQWEKFKEQNPDATLEDFGLAKAEEYTDAFIGGFISGGYMSGPVQTIVGAKQYINDQDIKADIENTQAKGASLGVEGMYDTTHKVQDASQQVMDAFTNDKGESTLSLDYINSLSSEEAYALATREGLTNEQRTALGGYAHVKAEYEGLTNKLDSNLEGNINAHKAMIEHVTTDDGKVVVGLYNGSPVYVKGGIEKNGKITTANGQNGPVVVINTVTGEKTSVNSNEITSGSSTNADEYTKLIESQLRENDAATREKWRNTMSDGAKQKDIQQYADSKVLINVGNGMTQVEVQKIMPNGQVLVKGKKGDLGGQSEVLMSASEFYDAIARDENGQPVFVEKLKVDMPVAQPNEKPVISEQPSGPVAVSDEDIDYMEEVVPIMVDGKVVNAEVTAQDNTSDSITYRYIDENGNVRVGGSTIGEFVDAKNKADELSKKTVVPGANDTNDTTVEPATPETPETPVINQQPTTAGTAPQEVPVTPQIVNWDALFENDQEAYFGELQNQYGDKAPRMLGAIVSATQKKLDALNKAVPDTDNEILENEAKKDKLEAKIQALNSMLERLNTPTDEVITEEVAPVETATDATITEEVPETTEETVEDVETPVEVVETVEDVETPVETVEDIEEVEEVTPAPVEEAAKKPEVTEVPTEVQAAEAKPVAPNPVANPVKAAQEREKPLVKLINRLDVEHELKADTAKRVGKEVADMFATREDYKEYEAVAGSLGDYLDFFDEGVEESFANRKNNSSAELHIGKAVDGNTNGDNKVSEEAKKLSLDAVLTKLKDSAINVVRATKKQVYEMLRIRAELSGHPFELMTVFHGSHAKFDKFDHSHMGEGEGAQAHGYGTYVAKMRDTSLHYANMHKRTYIGPKVERGSDEYEAADLLRRLLDSYPLKTFEQAKQGAIDFWESYGFGDARYASRAEFTKTLTKDDFSSRNLYTVEIPEDSGENYFDESNPNKKQVEKFYNACMEAGLEYADIIAGDSLLDNRPVGKKIMKNLSNILGSEKAASEFMAKSGFVGIKYNGRTDGECFVIFNESDAKITGHTEFYQTENGTIYGWTDGKNIYLTEAGMNPNTPIHEYTHLWARVMMQKNPKGWDSIKKLLKNTPAWNDVMNDSNYSNIHNDEDAVASEALSRISGTNNAAKLEQMAQQMIDEAKGTMRKAEARGLIQNMKDALNQFWSWVGKELFGIENFDSIDEITDRVLYDLMNNTDLGELSEGQVETQIVTDPKVIAELEASPKQTGYRNVVQNEDGTFSSPMAFWLQHTKQGAKSRIKTDSFELGKWEEAKENPEIVDETGHVTLVKPNKKTVSPVAYDPYIHNRLEPVNLQFKEAWKRSDLVYVETEVAETDLNSGYHADKAKLSVGVHSWSNGAVMLSKYDKPVRVMSWEEVADAWANRLNGEGVEFDVVPAPMRSLLVERGVEILPPHKNSGKECEDAYDSWKKENPQSVPQDLTTSPSPKVEFNQTVGSAQTKDAAKIEKSINNLRDIAEKYKESKESRPLVLVEILGNALNIDPRKNSIQSKRNKYTLPNGETISIRTSNHNTDAGTYIRFNYNQKYNLGITFKSKYKPNSFKANNRVRLDEYVYFVEDIEKYNGSVLSEIAESLASFLETGIYEDTTGIKKINTSPSGVQPRTKENYTPETLSRKGENNTKFVEQFEFKQNNESGQFEYSDEFRELQRESARMSGQLVSEKEGVQQAAISGLVGRIGGTLQKELDRARSGRGYKLRTVVNDSKGTSFDIIENVDGRLFHDIFEVVRAYLPNGELVDLHDNYNDAICYITSDGLAGFAVDVNGNLISVYSLYGASKRGFLGAIKDLITEAGATHLDGYNSKVQPLAKIYSDTFGWKVASMMDYNMEYDHDNIAENHGMPQVAFMVNTDADIETKHFNKDQYDDAVDYQLEQVEVSKRVDAQNAAIDNLVGEPRMRAIEHAVNKEADKLGVKVTYKTREQMPKGHKNDKGYYNTKTGEIVICTENNASIADAIQTILHEAVAHKGLRQLMGDKFDEFINRVYNSLDAKTKAKVDARAAAEYNGDTAVAMEEYMATLAESEDFNKNSVWDTIKSAFEYVINDILGRNDIKIGDNELRYILRASYNNMVNPKSMDTIKGWAQEQMMREEYGINKVNETPEILSRTGIDPTEVARMTAARTYDIVVKDGWQEFQRQFQDAYQPVRIAIDAIQQETGNIPVEDYENYLLIQNQSSSRSRVEIDNFARKQYTPIIKQINKIIDKLLEARGLDKKAIKDAKRRSHAYQEIIQYLIAKHGLERNKYYQEHKTRPLNKEEKELARKNIEQDYADELARIASTYTGSERKSQEAIAKQKYEAQIDGISSMATFDIRDYSGLTSLFGLEPNEYEEAESQAQELVDEFETRLGRVNDEESGEIISQSELIESLWKKINAATDKTLRHSYESGLISRQQYNDIKGMFNFYIPLRGFDETTAEDLYSYARFEGNRFNSVNQKAEGRTSLSDDPIATIMNMAESEITQGNKNRAKQALYNYILNRDSANNKRNSLMQLEDVWYVVSTDENGNKSYQIAAPDHEKGETYEEFEERMKEMEENGEAEKSKKGHVDVGVRFQKQRNKNAHYVYLKINGVDKAIYVNGDPKAADAINGNFHQKPVFGEEAARAANRVLSSMFTNYSLEFTARNYFRDLLYSHINIGVRESDPEYRVQFRKNWRKNNLRSMIKMLNAYKNGEFDGRELTDIEAAFVEFMENGGQTGYTIVNSVENHKRDLQKAIERMQEGVEKGGIKDSTAFKYTLGAIELLNESSELITRFAAYKTSRDMGRSVNTAINDAKEVTVNFNTKGAQDGVGWMGFVARYFGATKYFFNASVQGVQNIAAMAKANKLKFGSVVGGVIATGFFMPILTQLVLEALGADDDEAYWNIPEYERQNNLCIVVGGGKYVKIPLPIGFREMYAIGDMIAAMAMDKKFTRDVGQVGMDIANKVSSVVLPINPLEGSVNGLSLWYNICNTIMPSAGQFILQNMNNVDWKGAPLQKEYTYNENDPSWMKAFESNPDWMKGLSKWCNEHINLTGDYKGANWSPEKLDNTLSNLGGGIYSLIKKSGNTISMIWNEEKRNLINVPLAGVALGSGIDNDERFVTDAYFDMKDFYDSNIGYIKRRAEKFGYDLNDVFYSKAGEHHPKMQDIYNNRNFNFMQEWYAGNKELESLNNEIKNLKKNLGGEENMTEADFEALTGIQNELNNRRREFVNKMLEIE